MIEVAQEISSDDDEGEFGPSLPSAGGAIPQRKKRRGTGDNIYDERKPTANTLFFFFFWSKVLKHEHAYLNEIPSFDRYTKSFMHRDTLLQTHVSTPTNFILTLSIDGILKFWKKRSKGIEFVKQYQAHSGAIVGGQLSGDGKLFACIGEDNTMKVFDVVNFDMINIFKLAYSPGCLCWLQKRGQVDGIIAV